ncbi:hypothetical protein ACIOML_10905 [Streptomyces anulatus]
MATDQAVPLLVVIGATIVGRLQSIVAREIAPRETAVVTVGRLHVGSANNIIPATAELGLTVRSTSHERQTQILADGQTLPYHYWFLPSTPLAVRNAAPGQSPMERFGDVPSAHSPDFAPDPSVLGQGAAAMTGAVPAELASGVSRAASGT